MGILQKVGKDASVEAGHQVIGQANRGVAALCPPLRLPRLPARLAPQSP